MRAIPNNSVDLDLIMFMTPDPDIWQNIRASEPASTSRQLQLGKKASFNSTLVMESNFFQVLYILDKKLTRLRIELRTSTVHDTRVKVA